MKVTTALSRRRQVVFPLGSKRGNLWMTDAASALTETTTRNGDPRAYVRVPNKTPRRPSMLAGHVLLNCVVNPPMHRGGINSSPVVRTDAVDAAIACNRNE